MRNTEDIQLYEGRPRHIFWNFLFIILVFIHESNSCPSIVVLIRCQAFGLHGINWTKLIGSSYVKKYARGKCYWCGLSDLNGLIVRLKTPKPCLAIHIEMMLFWFIKLYGIMCEKFWKDITVICSEFMYYPAIHLYTFVFIRISPNHSSVLLSTHVSSINLSIHSYMHPPTDQATHLSIHLPTLPFIYLHTLSFLHLPTLDHPFIHLSYLSYS